MSVENWPSPNKELQYDKGENGRKHSGRHAEAMMVCEGSVWVGKCPQGFQLSKAQQLVQHGIPEFRSTAAEKPYRIWSYHEGAIYVARSQDGGKTWHGCPNGRPKSEPPRLILKQLEQRAKELGQAANIKNWLKKTWD